MRGVKQPTLYWLLCALFSLLPGWSWMYRIKGFVCVGAEKRVPLRRNENFSAL